MAIAIWPAAWLRKSTSSAVKVPSVKRTIIRSPSARPRLTSGIKHALFTRSAAASLYPSPPPGQPISSTVATIGFIVSKARLPGSFSGTVRITSSLAKPLLTGASNAYSLNVPASWPGNKIPAPSQRITSRKLAEIARSTSRRSRFEVMRLVRFRSNCRRSFCRCKLACGSCAHWEPGLLSVLPLISFSKKCPVIQQSVSQKTGWNHLASGRRFWEIARVKVFPGQRCLACSPRKTKQLLCDLRTILIGDITFDITQVLPSAHYVGFRTQSRSPDRSKEVDAQRCGPERFERREGGSKSHAHCRVGQIA